MKDLQLQFSHFCFQIMIQILSPQFSFCKMEPVQLKNGDEVSNCNAGWSFEVEVGMFSFLKKGSPWDMSI